MTTFGPLLPTPNGDDTRPSDQPEAEGKRQTRLSDTLRGLSRSISSPAASPAAASPPPESARGSGIPKLRFGVSSSDSFGSFDLATALSKTSQPSLLCTTESVSTRSFPGWPRAGIAVGGTCYPRAPLAPLTGGSGSSSLLATPTRWLGRRNSHATGDPERWHDPERSNELSDQVASLIPTPTSAPWRQGGTGAEQTEMKRGLGLPPTPTSHERTHTPRQVDHGRQLANEVDALLPTPRARVDKEHGPDGKHWGELRPTVEGLRRSTGAPTEQPSSDGKPSPGQRLSPLLPAWMMGLPDGWLDPNCRQSVMGSRFRSPTWLDGSLGRTLRALARGGDVHRD